MGAVFPLTRRQDYLDIFAVGTDGGVHTAAWNPTSKDGWHGWWRIHDITVPRNAIVQGVCRNPDWLEVFVTDMSGKICGAMWRPENPDSFTPWYQIKGGVAKPGAPVTAVGSGPYVHLFVVGLDGRVNTTQMYDYQASGSAKWTPLFDLKVPQGAYVAAVSRSSLNVDIFVADMDGRVMTTRFTSIHDKYGTHWGWREGWKEIQHCRVPPGSPVTACVRSQDQIDIFAVNTNGVVCTAAWNPTQTDGWHGWGEIGNQTKFPSGGWINAVSRSKDKLDIFGIARDGKTMTAAWAPNDQGWCGWWQIRGGIAHPGMQLSACVRNTDFLDIFLVGMDNQVASAGWQPENTDWWHGWWNIRNFTVTMPTQRYKFSIPQMHIFEIRSRHNDTLHMAISVAVGGRDPQKCYRFLGDQHTGWHNMEDSVTIEMGDNEWAVFAYVIINNSHENRPEVEKKLKDVVGFLAQKGADAAVGVDAESVGGTVGAAIGSAVGTGIVPIVGSALGVLAGWLIGHGMNIIFRNCDGPVASGIHAFKGERLRKDLESGRAVQGSDRVETSDVSGALKCGKPSDYDVYYDVSLA